MLSVNMCHLLLFFFWYHFNLLIFFLYTIIVFVSETISSVGFSHLIFYLSRARTQFKGITPWLNAIMFNFWFWFHCAKAEVCAEIFLALVETKVFVFF